MGSPSRMGLVQEVCRTLLRPPLLQQCTRPLQLWPRALCAGVPWMPGLVDYHNLRLGLRGQRARLPSKIFHPACEGLKMGSPSKMSFRGSMQEVCWMTLTPPPLQH